MRRTFFFASGIAVGLTLSAIVAAAWSGPTDTPPSNNVSAPLNVGATNQVKNANLGINGLAVFGNTLLGGATSSDAYLNFGPTSGSSGYGIWDNNGTLEFKNSGGSWATLQTTVYDLVEGGSGQWTSGSGGAIYYNAGNVGIGTASPSYPLTIVGGANNNWAEVINWPPSSAPGYGILVGTNSSDYSQFQNNAGYYSILAYSSWGLDTNGNIYASNIDLGYLGNWLSNYVNQSVTSGAAPTFAGETLNGTLSANGAIYNPGAGLLDSDYYVCYHGDVFYYGNYCSASDERLKTDIVPLADSQGLSAIMQLNPVNFQWKDPAQFGSGPQLGFLAQQVQPIFPQLVGNGGTTTISVDGATTTIPDTLSFDYQGLVVPLVKAVQEIDVKMDANASSSQASLVAQQKEIETLQQQNETLQREIEALESTH